LLGWHAGVARPATSRHHKTAKVPLNLRTAPSDRGRSGFEFVLSDYSARAAMMFARILNALTEARANPTVGHRDGFSSFPGTFGGSER
jgi:hypothetical protein